MDVLIVGASQSGLTMGYQLQKGKHSFRLVDATPRVGDAWRNRYDSLRLFTTNELSSLPGFPIPGDPEGYLTHNEFGDYLESYSRHFNLPVDLDTRIIKIERSPDESFCATSADGREYQARAIVVANGPYQKACVPDMSKNLSGDVLQLTADSYKNESQVLAGSNVLVVGDGATGRDMAVELSAKNTVYLATGSFRLLMPERIFGVPPGKLLTDLGVLTAPSESFVARTFLRIDPFPNRARRFADMRKKGIHIMPRLVRVQGNTAVFKNGASVAVNAVLWAVGFRDDSWDWIHIPGSRDADGKPIHRHGISPIKNLYYIGRPWQTSRMSTLIFGAKRDSELLALEINNALG